MAGSWPIPILRRLSALCEAGGEIAEDEAAIRSGSVAESLISDGPTGAEQWSHVTRVPIRDAGGAISHLTGGTQPADPNPFDANPTGADFAATVGGDWSFAIGGRFAVNW